MSETLTFGGPVVWEPDAETIARAHLTRFLQVHRLASFDELWQRSCRDVPWFTEAVLRYLDIRFRSPFTQVVDLERGPAWPRWCVGGTMNIVDSCLPSDRRLAPPEALAVLYEAEFGEVRQLTYAELDHRVNQMAAALRSLGLGKGDAVGLFMPMIPEIVVALLAVAKIGGVILPLFSGFGPGAVASRLEDGRARALITADGLPRRGAIVALKPIADEAAQRVPTLQHQIVVRHMGNRVPMQAGRDQWWHELVQGQPASAETEVLSAEDVLMIIYTSGTTGRPKGAVHTHCGFPVKAAQDMAFGTDVHAGDRMFWITDMGWMMGPWLVFGSLILGATMFLFDGAPDYPGPDRLWSMVERHRLTALGISPTLVRALAPQGEAPVRAHDLSSLRLFGSTGEPWNPEPWRWLFDVPGESRRPIINYSGGTEVSGGILMGNPLRPLKPCAFSAPCPGIAADVVDENGRSLRGQVGELVIRAPWIGMTRGFWGDPQRYEETYWSRWPGVWVHGDWAAVDQDGLWYILGRSDDTLKVAGKRLGPAEVESSLVAHPDVVEAAAIGVPDPVKGTQVVCFCVLQAGVPPSAALKADLRGRLITELGKALAPKEVIFVPDLPKTRNAKIMRRMIRSAYLGEEPGDVSSLVNPESLEAIAHAGQEDDSRG
ncbi:MAG TPA: AMP-binding protein [Anaerolineales bacterium]|nr:AMP-binding protein [Anaerolineales bacterium]